MAGVIMNIQGSRAQVRTPMDLVAALHRPVSELLPADAEAGPLDALILLDQNDELTDTALDVATDYTFALFDGELDPASSWLPQWAWQRDEQVERSTFQALWQAGDQSVYTASRRFLIERPAGFRQQLIDERNTSPRYAGAKVVAEYGDIPADRTHRAGSDSESCWWPCPVCRWPMKVKRRAVFCSYSPHEARFEISTTAAEQPQLRRLSPGRMRMPKPLAVTGSVCLDLAIWRFVSIPGIPELALEELATDSENIRVTLWPIKDTFDALIIVPGCAPWSVDIKDHVNARRIIENPPAAQHIVVPSYRKSQVAQLERALPGKKIWTLPAFMRHVRAVAAGGIR